MIGEDSVRRVTNRARRGANICDGSRSGNYYCNVNCINAGDCIEDAECAEDCLRAVGSPAGAEQLLGKRGKNLSLRPRSNAAMWARNEGVNTTAPCAPWLL